MCWAWNLGEAAASEPPVLRPEAGALELLRRNSVDAPRMYQSLEKGTLPLLCTGILPLSRVLVAKQHSAALRCPHQSHATHHNGPVATPDLPFLRHCAETGSALHWLSSRAGHSTGQPLVPKPALPAAVAQAARAHMKSHKHDSVWVMAGERIARVTWSLHLKAQVPLPMSKASGHSHMRQAAPNWSQAPLPACATAGCVHCAFVACPSDTCTQLPV